MSNELNLLSSESLLSLYPQLIKNVPLSIDIQTLLRVLTIAVSAYVSMKKPTDVRPDYQQGFLNTLHILSSYYAFQTIHSGDALALFYTYPMFNLLFSHMMLKEKIDSQDVMSVLTGVTGAFMIAQPGFESRSIFGILSALLSAITESLMYISYHDPKSKSTPVERLYELYAGSVPYTLIIAWIMYDSKKNINIRSFSQVIIFNVIIGFYAHLLRAKAALHLTTPLFSSLSLWGVIMGYIFQFYFEKKLPSIQTITGGLLIIISGLLSIYKKKK
jgi:drug/metabolite transporter (DMT)-like permease